MTGTLSRDEKNPLYDMVCTLLQDDNVVGAEEGASESSILSTFKKIVSSQNREMVFMYLYKHKAATCWLLQFKLKMPTPTTYHVMKEFRAVGIVEPIVKVRNRVKRPGPLPKLWGLMGFWTEEDASQAIRLHYKTQSPKYRAAEKVAESLLDNLMRRGRPLEMRYLDIVPRVKALGIPFSTPDIAQLAVQYLHEKGVKVWM